MKLLSSPIRSRALPLATILLLAVLLPGLASPAGAGDLEVDGAFVSTAPPGTPPLDVASSTRVDGLNADLLDGEEASVFSRKLARVVRVAKSGGDFTSIQAALDSITDANSSRRYLVKVGPGIYSESVSMKPYVDIEGSGRQTTRIRAVGGSTVFGADHAELRSLGVDNLDDGVGAGYGIFNADASPRIVDVDITAASSAVGVRGIYTQAFSGQAAPVIRDVTVHVEGPDATGIQTHEATGTITDVEVYARGEDARGVTNSKGTAKMRRVEIDVQSAVDGVGTNIGVFNDDEPADMSDVRAIVRGGHSNYGVLNQNVPTKMTMVRVEAIAIGGTFSDGIRNTGSRVEMVDCRATASGASSENQAVYNDRSDVQIHGSHLIASGSGSNWAVYNDNSTGAVDTWVVTVHRSRLSGSTLAVQNHKDFTVLIGATFFDQGGVSSDGTSECAGVYDQSFTFYPDTCPGPASTA